MVGVRGNAPRGIHGGFIVNKKPTERKRVTLHTGTWAFSGPVTRDEWRKIVKVVDQIRKRKKKEKLKSGKPA